MEIGPINAKGEGKKTTKEKKKQQQLNLSRTTKVICCQCQPCACPTLHTPRAPALHPQGAQLGQGQAKESRSRMQKTQGRKLFNQFIRRACCTCMCVCQSPSLFLFLSPSLCVCVFGNNRQDINLQFSTQTSHRVAL